MKTNPPSLTAQCPTQNTTFIRRLKRRLLAGFFILGLTPVGAEAGTIFVNTNLQCNGTAAAPVNCGLLNPAVGDGDNFCSLGEAIMAANTDLPFGPCAAGSGSDLIVLLATGPYNFTKVDNVDTDACKGPNALPTIEGILRIDAQDKRLVRNAADPNFFRLAHLFRGITTFDNAAISNFNPGCDPIFCGNGILEKDRNEECDAGVDNITDGVGCDAQCQLESCGNGIVDDGEQCDPQVCSVTGENCDDAGDCPTVGECLDPNGSGTGNPCATDAECEGKFGPGSICDLNTTQACADNLTDDCSPNCENLVNNGNLCGNGIIDYDQGESCDTGGVCVNSDGTPYEDANANPIPCTTDAFCQSPDTNPSGGVPSDSCAPQNDDGDNCTNKCQLETCGNGTLETPEECDPGSTCSQSGNDCSADGQGACDPGVCIGTNAGDPCTAHVDCGTARTDRCLFTDVCTTNDETPGCNETCRLEYCDRCYSGGAFLVGNENETGGSPAELRVHSSFLSGNRTLTSPAPLTLGRGDGIGGAIAATEVSDTLPRLEITDTRFDNNESSAGGAIVALATDMGIANSSFANNRSIIDSSPENQPGGGGGGNPISGAGGAIASALSNVVMEQSAFYDNFSESFGGAVTSFCSAYDINNSSFFENISFDIGGGFMAVMDPVLCAGLFANNGDGGNGGGGGNGLGGHCRDQPDLQCDPNNTTSNQCASRPFPNDICIADDTTGGGGNDNNGDGGLLGGLLDDPLLLIDFLSDKTIDFKSSTIAFNYAHVQGGGLFVIDGGELLPNVGVTLMNTILADNIVKDINNNASDDSPNCDGELVSNDHNLFGDLTGCVVPFNTHDLQGDPDFRGPNDFTRCFETDITAGRQYCSPSCEGSDALDRASLDGPSVDQLGVFRYPPDGTADIGAIERNDCTFCGNGVTEIPAESCDNGGLCSETGTPCLGTIDCAVIVDGVCNSDGTTPCTRTNETTTCPTLGDFCNVPQNACEPQSGDGCSDTCALETCGDGILQTGEQCDDGKQCPDLVTDCTTTADCLGGGACAQRSGDGCNAACNDESCGDGVVNNAKPDGPTESCDDGNNVDNDACGNNCQPPVCGDSIVEGNEECEFDANGNAIDIPDDCFCHPTSCELECGGGGGSGVCGDGIQQPGEQCDNGGQCASNEDACNSDEDCVGAVAADCINGICAGDSNTSCTTAADCEVCTPRAGDGCSPLCQIEGCGDGVLDPDGPDQSIGTSDDEQCDDGNNITGDGCTSTCVKETCGDGLVSPIIGETCDSGSQCVGGQLNGADCAGAPSICLGGTCEQFDSPNCNECQLVNPCDHDSVVDPGELCDDGDNDNTDNCRNDCTPNICGDTFVDLDGPNDIEGDGDDQDCDDGNQSDNDACTSSCKPAVCGDGLFQSGVEECDDGNTDDGDGCSANCELEPSACGNGIPNPGEDCDDGKHCIALSGPTNVPCDDISDCAPFDVACQPVPGDGCDGLCQREFCGDHVVDANGADNTLNTKDDEECDDGDFDQDDGCLIGCITATCGDGIVWTGVEQCDDGGLCSDNNAPCTNLDLSACGAPATASCIPQDDDGCDSDCRSEIVCDHDGVVDAGEICDDGNNVNTDNCRNDCSENICGDTFVDVDGPNDVDGDGDDQDCDDGNTADGDGCNASCKVQVCGNGTTESGEDCDDGNTIDGDGCSSDCKDEGCGDGVFDPDGADNSAGGGDDEQCDDGNNSPGDGCSPTCTLDPLPTCGDGNQDPGEDCDDGNVVSGDGCSATCHPEGCGDGVVDADGADNDSSEPATQADDEICDDGNLVPGDGCSPTCREEACGDGIVTFLFGEECDDGNTNDDDGCSATCRLESCGNGVVEGSEGCDDGNNNEGDGCTGLCVPEDCGNGTVDTGEECDDGNGSNVDGCTIFCERARCGDGLNQGAGNLLIAEECDDGNNNNNDGCSGTCQLEEFCGDGTIQGTETCDDGNKNSLDGCSSTCVIEECGDGVIQATLGEVCDDGDTIDEDECSNDCRLPRCGDGINQAGEECDDGNLNAHDDCTNSCLDNICGDGILLSQPEFSENAEACDDGNGIDTDACDNDCTPAVCGDGTVQIQAGEECDPDDGVNYGALGLICVNCELEGGNPHCGDGIVQPNEECDDGDSVNTNACTNACTDAICGDGIAGPGEECDDGDSDMDDGCLNDCTQAACGDAIVFSGVEQCDDGNTVDGDGCDSGCITETGEGPVCGNGTVQSGEECDDGNTSNGDGCSSNCQNEDPTEPSGAICGNGSVEGSEECDEGEARNSNLPNATCRTDCTEQRCGDDIVDAGEECDGNRVDCSATCVIDLCLAIRDDAKRVGTPGFSLTDYLNKYDVDPFSGLSPNEDVNECQPLKAVGGANNTNDIGSSVGSSGCTLTGGKPDSAPNTALALLIALPASLMVAIRARRTVRVRAGWRRVRR